MTSIKVIGNSKPQTWDIIIYGSIIDVGRYFGILEFLLFYNFLL